MSQEKLPSDTTRGTKACIPREEIVRLSQDVARVVLSSLNKFAVDPGPGGSHYDCSASDNFTCGSFYDCISTFFANPECPGNHFSCQGHFSCSGTFQG